MSKPIDPDLTMSGLVEQVDNAMYDMVKLLEQTATRKEANHLWIKIEEADFDLNAKKIWDKCTFKWSD